MFPLVRAKLPDEAVFCYKCGHKVVAENNDNNNDVVIAQNKVVSKTENISKVEISETTTTSSIPIRPVGLSSELCVPTPVVEKAMELLNIKKDWSDFLDPNEERMLRLALREAKRYKIHGVSDSVFNMDTNNMSGVGGNSYETGGGDFNMQDVDWEKVGKVVITIGKLFFV
ncbi:MAG: zinc ribbon domain-containing protein [Phascolarctobacterium sp.]|nr:zinc ribbon domain-containing protein [Candidatus Phascolarctobacterium caballi]